MSRRFCPHRYSRDYNFDCISFSLKVMFTFFVFNDDFKPSGQTSTMFFCFTREDGGRSQTSNDSFSP